MLLLSYLMSGVRSLESSDNLYQLHHRHWIHKMHANDFIRPFGETRQLSDGDR